MRAVGVRLVADVSQYVRTVGGDAVKATRGLTGEMDRAAKAGRLDEVSDQAGRMGLVAAGAFALVVKASADFEKQMSSVSAATRANTKDMGRLRDAALEAGKDTSFSAVQAAKGIEELSKAGVSTASILSGGLKGALDLAAAGNLDVGEAAETAASAMTQFKLKGSDVPHIADLLAAAAGKAQGSVHDMGMALGQSGLVAAQMGLSVEEATGTLAAFASAGLIGSDAGTSFKQSMLMLSAPTDKAADLMRDLGINAYDAQGNFVGMTGLAGQLKSQLGGLTQEQRNAALATIFGADAIRAASVLYEQGATGIQSWINKTNDAGYASETAAIKTDNLVGDLERLKGSLETLAIESGGSATGGLRTMVKAADNLVGSLAGIPAPVQNAAVLIAGIGGAALLAGAGVGKFKSATSGAMQSLSDVGPRGTKAATGLGKVGNAAGKASIALAALQVAGAVLGEGVDAKVGAMAGGLEKFAASGTLAGESARVLGGDMGLLDQALTDVADTGRWSDFIRGTGGIFEALTQSGGVYQKSLQHSRERLQALDDTLAQMISGGKGQQAADIFKQIAVRAAEQGISVAELNKVLPGYTAALETAGGAAAGTAGDVKALGGAAGATAADVKKLTAAFDELFDVQLTADEAQIKYREGMRSLSAEARSGTRTLSLNSEEGLKNRKAVLAQIEVIKALRDSRIAQGGALDSVNAKYVRDIDGLRKTLRQAGFTKTQIDQLTGSYRRMPGVANTKVAAPGAKVAKKQVDDFNWGVRQVDPRANTKISVTGAGKAMATLAQLVVMQRALKKGVSMSAARALAGDSAAARDRGLFAGGGWTGPGSTYDPAGVVHADEHVIQKASRRKIESRHPGLLDYINEHGTLPGYARGGPVTWPFPTTAADTRIPSRNEVTAVVIPAGPSGGATAPWMERMIESRFSGLEMISGFRRGSRTLSGSQSYHALNRAVDFPPSRALAEFMYRNYKSQLREAITPYQQFNVHNGRDHRYTGAVWRQHAFGYGNAHDHFAMANGGQINEPVFGYGRSGSTYSFGELGPETVTPGAHSGSGTTVVHVTVQAGYVVSERDLEDKIASTVDNLIRKSRI